MEILDLANSYKKFVENTQQKSDNSEEKFSYTSMASIVLVVNPSEVKEYW